MTQTARTAAYRFAAVNGRKVFYREAGDPAAPTIILLHGFPTSSFMFRDLIPQLAGRFHVVAPDYIGFGRLSGELQRATTGHSSPLARRVSSHPGHHQPPGSG